MSNAHLSAFSPAKINLFLHVTGRREDGYHLLQSVFCPITLGDEVDLTLENSKSGQLEISRTGDLIHIPEETDLTVRACKAFYANANVGQAHRINIQVRKQVPEQAGLGGGTPTPRKDSVASDRMARPRLSVAMTSTGPRTLGRT